MYNSDRDGDVMGAEKSDLRESIKFDLEKMINIIFDQIKSTNSVNELWETHNLINNRCKTLVEKVYKTGSITDIENDAMLRTLEILNMTVLEKIKRAQNSIASSSNVINPYDSYATRIKKISEEINSSDEEWDLQRLKRDLNMIESELYLKEIKESMTNHQITNLFDMIYKERKYLSQKLDFIIGFDSRHI